MGFGPVILGHQEFAFPALSSSLGSGTGGILLSSSLESAAQKTHWNPILLPGFQAEGGDLLLLLPEVAAPDIAAPFAAR